MGYGGKAHRHPRNVRCAVVAGMTPLQLSCLGIAEPLSHLGDDVAAEQRSLEQRYHQLLELRDSLPHITGMSTCTLIHVYLPWFHGVEEYNTTTGKWTRLTVRLTHYRMDGVTRCPDVIGRMTEGLFYRLDASSVDYLWD